MAKNTTSETARRGRGRPNKFDGNPRLRNAVVSTVEAVGNIKDAREVLGTDGVSYQPAPGKKKVTEVVEISLPTLSKICREAGLSFKRGVGLVKAA